MLSELIDDRIVKIFSTDQQTVDTDGMSRLAFVRIQRSGNRRDFEERVITPQRVDRRPLNRDQAGSSGDGASDRIGLIDGVVEHSVDAAIDQPRSRFLKTERLHADSRRVEAERMKDESGRQRSAATRGPDGHDAAAKVGWALHWHIGTRDKGDWRQLEERDAAELIERRRSFELTAVRHVGDIGEGEAKIGVSVLDGEYVGDRPLARTCVDARPRRETLEFDRHSLTERQKSAAGWSGEQPKSEVPSRGCRFTADVAARRGHGQHRRERDPDEMSSPHHRSRSASRGTRPSGLSVYPLPRTVWMNRGRLRSGSIFLRNRAMALSTDRV